MKVTWILTAIFFLWTYSGSVKGASSCQNWNTISFFKHAKVADVSRCLNAGAKIDARSSGGVTPLHFAATHKQNPKIVKMLLDAGAKIDARSVGENTPLHSAVYSQDPKIVEMLLDAGAKIDARTWDGSTPLHLAARNSKNPKVIEVLLNAGADPKVKDESGSIPWDYATKNSALKGTDAYWRLNEARFQ